MNLASTCGRSAFTIFVFVSLIIALASNHAQAVNEYFDTNGTGTGSGVTANGIYTWENNWSTDSTGATATTNWPDGNNFPIFAAGTDAAASNYTVNVGSNHTFAGMALATNGGGTVLVASTGGTLNMFSNVAGQGLFVGGVSSQNLKITAPIGGDNVTPLVWGGLFGGTASGSLYLYGNNTFQGGVTLNTSAGVNINSGNAFGNGGTVTWGAGTTFVIAVPNNNGVFGGGDATSGFTIANPMKTKSASNLIFVSSTAAPVTWSGNWTLATGLSTLTTNTANTNLTVSGVISGTDATSAFTKGGTTSTTTLTLSNTANSYQGATSVSGGTLSIPSLGNTGSNSSIGQNSTLNLGSTTNTATLLYTGTGETSNKVVNLAGTTGGATIDQSGTGALKITGNMTATGVGAKTLTLQGSTSGTGEIAGKIVDSSSGATSVTKAGSGTWTLSGANTYTGTTAVNAGTLVMASAGAVPGANALTLGGGTLSNGTGATKTISGSTTLTASSTISGANDINFSGAFTNSGGGRTLTVNNTGATFGTVNLSEAAATGRTFTVSGSGNTTFGGVIQNASAAGAGNGTLAFASGYTGTATINGTNTYSGATTLTGGAYTVSLGNKSAFGTSAVAANGVTITANTNLSGANAIGNTTTLGGDNTFTGTNNLEFSGSVTATSSRKITNNMSTGILTLSGPVNLSSNGNNNTLTVDGTGNTAISGAIGNGSGGSTASKLTKSGGGTLTLSGTNTYGGATSVTAGTLLVNGSNTGTGLVTVTGGTLGGSGSIAGTVTVNGGTLSPGNSPGTLNIGGDLNLTAGTYKYEIASNVPTADLVNVTGALNIAAAAVSLAASDTPAQFLAYGTKFTLISYAGAWNNGTFIGLPNYSTSLVVGANRYQIIYNDSTAGSINSPSVLYATGVTITAVPEASAFLIVSLGGMFAIGAFWLNKRFGLSKLEL